MPYQSGILKRIHLFYMQHFDDKTPAALAPGHEKLLLIPHSKLVATFFIILGMAIPPSAPLTIRPPVRHAIVAIRPLPYAPS